MGELEHITNSKRASNYRYPVDCCGTCTHSFQSTYGDYQCTQLYAGNTIDFGAICDHYHKELTNEFDGA